MEEWKRKCLSAQEEAKKLQRALAKELGEGEGITIEQVRFVPIVLFPYERFYNNEDS